MKALLLYLLFLCAGLPLRVIGQSRSNPPSNLDSIWNYVYAKTGIDTTNRVEVQDIFSIGKGCLSFSDMNVADTFVLKVSHRQDYVDRLIRDSIYSTCGRIPLDSLIPKVDLQNRDILIFQHGTMGCSHFYDYYKLFEHPSRKVYILIYLMTYRGNCLRDISGITAIDVPKLKAGYALQYIPFGFRNIGDEKRENLIYGDER